MPESSGGRPTVSAVITNHKSEGTILNVLQALLQQDVPVERIIVVDNASGPEADAIQQAYPQTRLIRLTENLGLAHARNVGLGEAESEFVLFLDDDVYPAPDCVRRMLEACLRGGADAICPRIVLHPANDVIQCDGASVHFAGMLALNHKDLRTAATHSTLEAVGAFIGACLLIRRKLLLDLAGFDGDYFFYFEDMELSYRLRSLGYSIWCEPLAVVSHDRGHGTPGLSFRSGGPYPSRRAYFTLRHRWLTLALHYERRTLVLLSPALALYELAAFLECLQRGWLSAWFEATAWLLSRLPAIWARRQKWQAARRVRDGQILRGGPLPFSTGFVGEGAAASVIAALDWTLNQYWNGVAQWL
jgi:GT2 family glycosyltransferase